MRVAFWIFWGVLSGCSQIDDWWNKNIFRCQARKPEQNVLGIIIIIIRSSPQTMMMDECIQLENQFLVILDRIFYLTNPDSRSSVATSGMHWVKLNHYLFLKLHGCWSLGVQFKEVKRDEISRLNYSASIPKGQIINILIIWQHCHAHN